MSDQDNENSPLLGAVIGLAVTLVIGVVIGVAVLKHRGDAPAEAAAAPVTATGTMVPDDAASVQVVAGVVKFYFASGKTELAADGTAALIDILAGAKEGKKIAISGFVDPSGDAQKNAELAKQRALAVRDLLMANGLTDSQIVMVRPNDIQAGATTAAEGRRVEVSLL